MKIFFFFISFVFLSITDSQAQNITEANIYANSANIGSIGYIGGIHPSQVTKEEAEKIVLERFKEILSFSTREAVINKNDPNIPKNIIKVDIFEDSKEGTRDEDKLLFYSVEIDRETGREVHDIQYARQEKITADLKRKEAERTQDTNKIKKFQEFKETQPPEIESPTPREIPQKEEKTVKPKENKKGIFRRFRK